MTGDNAPLFAYFSQKYIDSLFGKQQSQQSGSKKMKFCGRPHRPFHRFCQRLTKRDRNIEKKRILRRRKCCGGGNDRSSPLRKKAFFLHSFFFFLFPSFIEGLNIVVGFDFEATTTTSTVDTPSIVHSSTRTTTTTRRTKTGQQQHQPSRRGTRVFDLPLAFIEE